MLLAAMETIKAVFALQDRVERKINVSGLNVNIICPKSFAKGYTVNIRCPPRCL